MTLPTIHMNGDSGASLREDHVEAMRAVADAIEAMQKVSPNGRNFYPQGADAYNAARNEHSERLTKLAAVRDELEAIAMHCAEFAKD